MPAHKTPKVFEHDSTETMPYNVEAPTLGSITAIPGHLPSHSELPLNPAPVNVEGIILRNTIATLPLKPVVNCDPLNALYGDLLMVRKRITIRTCSSTFTTLRTLKCTLARLKEKGVKMKRRSPPRLLNSFVLL